MRYAHHIGLAIVITLAVSLFQCLDATVNFDFHYVTLYASVRLTAYSPECPGAPGIDRSDSGGWWSYWGSIGSAFGSDSTPGLYKCVLENEGSGITPSFITSFDYTIKVDGTTVRTGTVTLSNSGDPSIWHQTTVNFYYGVMDPSRTPRNGPCHPDPKTASDPIAYPDGEIYLSHDDLISGAAGGWGLSRSYSNSVNRTADMPQPLGPGWFINQTPFIHAEWDQGALLNYEIGGYGGDSPIFPDAVVINFDANTSKRFNIIMAPATSYDFTDALYMNAAYALAGEGEDTLTTETVDGVRCFHYRDGHGNQLYFSKIGSWVYHPEWDGFVPYLDSIDGNIGSFLCSINPAGLETHASYNEAHQLTQISRTVSSSETELFTYAYDLSTGQISSVQRQILAGGITTTLREADYEYYPTGSTISPASTLERVTIKDVEGNIIDRMYYRYYFGTEIDSCYPNALKYVINTRQYGLMEGAGINPMTASDSQIGSYASHYFEYCPPGRLISLQPGAPNFAQFVVIHKIQGDGIDNNGTYTYSYEFNDILNHDPSVWYIKTTETLPDGNKTIVYSNCDCNIMFKGVYNTSSSNYISMTAYTYDSQGREIQDIDGLAIASINESAADLGIVLNSSGGKITNMSWDATSMEFVSDLIASVTETDASGTLSIPVSTTTYLAQQQYSTDTAWADDAVPDGSSLNTDGSGVDEPWTWTGFGSNTLTPFHGCVAHQSALVSGFHEHYFIEGSPITPVTGDELFTYVYLNASHPPSEIMLQFYDYYGWEHRAYWGANDIAEGTDGTESRCYEGALPATGSWVRLQWSAADIGIEGQYISGMKFSTYDGQVTYDYSGITHDGVDYAWVDDGIPTGGGISSTNESWSWIGDTPDPVSGTLCHQSPEAAGYHEHTFSGATTPLAIGNSDTLYGYVYLDPTFPPSEVMLRYYDGTSWDHQVYWGADDMDFGVGTRTYAGPLPATGGWIKLQFSASSVGLGACSITGMAFSLYDGEAWFDRTGVISTSGPTAYFVASQTTYRDASPTGALTTNYTYTFRPNTLSVASVVTALPSVTTAENGRGVSAFSTSTYDEYGRLEWLKDASGYLHYNAYDPISGAMNEHIDDVNTATTSDFVDLPTGWLTPSGGGLNLMTTKTVDAFGRATAIEDPNGNVTYTTYDDVNHEMRSYAGWQTSTSTPSLPTIVEREDRAHGYDEYLTMVATPACTAGIPNGSESIGSLRSLRRQYYDAGGRTTDQDTYAAVTGLTYSTSSSIGTLGSNYYQRQFAYDTRNNPCRVINENGTITRTVFDSVNHPISVWIGTNDTPTSGTWSPSNNTGAANMVDVEDRVYDVDSNLTSLTSHPTGIPTDDRVTLRWYDFADRCIAWKSGAQVSESTGVGRLLTYLTLDDRGLPTSTAVYAADNVTLTSTGGEWSVPTDALLVSYKTAAFDELGQCYVTTNFGVDPATGAVSASGLTTNTWFSDRGEVLKQQKPGGLVTKNQWDGPGRIIRVSQTDGGGDSAWGDAGNESGDAVLHQDLLTYDGNGNVILITKKDRFDSETSTGDLGNTSTAPLARVSYEGQYFDDVNRLIAQADVGTNAGASYTRPFSAPTRSPLVHVVSKAYNDAGYLGTTTDPRNITTAFDYDARGLKTIAVEAYDASVDGGLPSASNNRTTVTTYDGLGHQLSVTAVMPAGTASQTTAYAYGVTTSSGSTLNSNDLMSRVAFPDPTTGAASTASAHQRVFTYNSLGQNLSVADGNGNVHAFTFDVLGRPLNDAITTLGSGVDGAVRLISTSYNPQGYAYLFTSYSAVSSGSIVNQVQRSFNDLGQIITEFQAPTGSVNTSTSLSTQWVYDDLSGGVNDSRIIGLVYPNGRGLTYNYNSGIDSSISRISYLADATGSSAEVHLEDSSYLGLATMVLQHHPEPGFDYSMLKQGSESVGDSGDQYSGIDRFGQLVDARWLTTSTGTAIDRFQYGYDNDGDVIYENNKTSSSFSLLFGGNGVGTQSLYDPFNRMTSFARGTLSASGGNTTSLGLPYESPILDTVSTVNHPSSSHPVSGEQSWTFDQLGNWTSVATDGTTDTRTHNAQNQVTATSDYSAIGYDSNGNVTSQTGETTNIFDAWNRGVSIRGSTFTYDALGRRVTESDSTDSQFFYYAGQQMIENAPQFGATVRHQQFVYGIDYIDHVILRDRDADNAGDTGSLGGIGSGLEERLYYTHNRQFSVTGLVSLSGSVVERTIYDPYGESQYFSASYTSPTSTSSYSNNVSFTGRWVDPTGELYFRARYYDPELGRFISQDPMMYIDGMSMYGYCRGNPSSLGDPLGLCSHDDTGPGYIASFIEGWYQGGIDSAYGLGKAIASIPDIGRMGWNAAMYYNNENNGLGQFTKSNGQPLGWINGSWNFLPSENHFGIEDKIADTSSSTQGWSQALGAFTLSAVAPETEVGLVAEAANPVLTDSALLNLNRSMPDVVLQTLVDRANLLLGADPSLARTVLSPPEYAAGQAGMGPAQYGNALERMVRDAVAQDPAAAGALKYVGGPGKPDFVGQGLWKGASFDITTQAQIPTKFIGGVPKYQDLTVIPYVRPSGATPLPCAQLP